MSTTPEYTVLERLTLPASEPAAGEARRWLRKVVGEHPRLDDAVMLLSEAVGNSVLHTDSPVIGIVVLVDRDGDLMVEVIDRGSATVPTVAAAADDPLAESGRGLRLIRALSARWGFAEEPPYCLLWFLLTPHPEPGASSSDRDGTRFRSRRPRRVPGEAVGNGQSYGL
jgi:anti-sigma regulatory factor (Ser/Thr protein kinase)